MHGVETTLRDALHLPEWLAPLRTRPQLQLEAPKVTHRTQVVDLDDRLFVSARCYKPGGAQNKPPGYRGIGPEALAKVMGRIMTRAKVPADFLPHSARHAGINYRRKQGWTDEDIMSHANMSARTYVLHYMRNIRRGALAD